MKPITRAICCNLLLTFFFINQYGAQAQTRLDPSRESKISELIKKMTLNEKVGQMAQVAIDVFVPSGGQGIKFNEEKLNDAVVTYGIGSILNTPGGKFWTARDWNDAMTVMQGQAAKSRLKIPILYGLDDNHGANYVVDATLFPQEIAQAATWNRQLVYNAAVITAYEGRAAGVPWTFCPVVDLGTNPQWPRIWEDFGEDPFLSAEMGVQAVKGFQDPLGSKEKLVVSLKHYMAYSDPKSGKDRTDAWIPEHYLREYHLPAFEAAINAGARTVMVNSALINGIPTHINKHIITDILKNELHFNGLVVTDWQDIENVYRRDHIAHTIKEAIMLSINAGIDMSMIPFDYKEFCNDLVALVKEGKVSAERINDAVRRILRIKYEVDLFNTPLTFFKDYPKYASNEFHKASYEAASEAITLLKNTNNTLPLQKSAKLLITGPNANSMRCLNGGWSYTWQGERTNEFTGQYHTILAALTNKFGQSNVVYVPGVAYNEKGQYFQDSIVNIDAVVQAAAGVDYIVLCVGENSYTETPGNLNDLSLSYNQQLLAAALSKTGKPVIFILNEGRPRIFNNIEPIASAILDIYLPSNFGGDALADVLAGDVNPSGKLPITYPRFTNALTGYIHKPSDGGNNPQGGEFNPQYQFGFGLSYTHFDYSDIMIDKKTYEPNEILNVSVTVKNTGQRPGKEVVQLFISQLVASLTPDVKRLRGFEKIELQPGESRKVSFRVPLKNLAFVAPDNHKRLEEGDFKIQIENQTSSFHINHTFVY